MDEDVGGAGGGDEGCGGWGDGEDFCWVGFWFGGVVSYQDLKMPWGWRGGDGWIGEQEGVRKVMEGGKGQVEAYLGPPCGGLGIVSTVR